jgi:lysophospholipase L1-like esterase
MKKYLILIVLTLISQQLLHSQDPTRFQSEIDVLKHLNAEREPDQKTILFTGSSSIRMWKDIQDYFPGKTIINTGFGGSHMSDLLFYLDTIVIQYNPDQIFIYEGDNDISAGKEPGAIMKDTKKVIRKLNKALPDVPVGLISPKPSLARWNLKAEYIELNQRFCRYATRKKQVDFINIWPVMLNPEGQPAAGLFIEDGLHMTKAGYDLWAGEIKKHMK